VSLTAAEVAEILRLLESSSFDELELEMGGVKLSLRRGAGAAPPHPSASQRPAQPAPPPPAQQVQAPAAPLRGDEVTAPLLGTFYRAPRPGAPPFVEAGSEVVEDTVVGIIEVMKLMNTVRAGRRGRVSEVLAEDGALVEYGQPLLRVTPSGQ
jgi:acetyl-CoA carboxylase biotin carboxyl carrier protein